ncbi:hypothetical protein SERLA73DRAFT_150259 [Serpula lacrymans var. lacrymans S7.3]|uniref:Uncharacterized protein n=1 Tax=Serpula lacrymans var. lacrymans (strain S7.3) TaxID=936435 RepID=F8PLT0_SERL3|nr:hypothetical protein SERLA73DRAFT_150259 [Serpula lacrymans var. lacrymans S7.3]
MSIDKYMPNGPNSGTSKILQALYAPKWKTSDIKGKFDDNISDERKLKSTFTPCSHKQVQQCGSDERVFGSCCARRLEERNVQIKQELELQREQESQRPEELKQVDLEKQCEMEEQNNQLKTTGADHKPITDKGPPLKSKQHSKQLLSESSGPPTPTPYTHPIPPPAIQRLLRIQKRGEERKEGEDDKNKEGAEMLHGVSKDANNREKMDLHRNKYVYKASNMNIEPTTYNGAANGPDTPHWHTTMLKEIKIFDKMDLYNKDVQLQTCSNTNGIKCEMGRAA